MAEITAIVVGNIGSGKSTFLTSLEKRKTGSRLLPLLSMPGEIKVEKEAPEVLKIVDTKFYPALKEKNKDILFVAEIDILNERIKQLQANLRQGGIVFNERCPYEDRYVFVANLYNSGYLLKEHYEIYKREYEYRMRSITSPDLLIYLYTKPETAFRRRMEELRKGTGGLKSESDLTLEYLKSLHELYEKMINEELPKEIPNYRDVLLIIDADKDFGPKEIIRFHNYIEERAHRLLMKRMYFNSGSKSNINELRFR
jgi:deoxyadenosine/deoxycytidine kinase